MSAVLATRAVAPAAHGAAARRLTAGRSAFVHAAPPSIKRAFAARRASASRATHVLTTAGWNDFEWGTATVVSNEPAAAEGGLRSVKVSVDEACAEAYGTPGQFVQMRTNADSKPAFLAIASPPRAEPKTVLELLIKSTEGTAGEIAQQAPFAIRRIVRPEGERILAYLTFKSARANPGQRFADRLHPAKPVPFHLCDELLRFHNGCS